MLRKNARGSKKGTKGMEIQEPDINTEEGDSSIIVPVKRGRGRPSYRSIKKELTELDDDGDSQDNDSFFEKDSAVRKKRINVDDNPEKILGISFSQSSEGSTQPQKKRPELRGIPKKKRIAVDDDDDDEDYVPKRGRPPSLKSIQSNKIILSEKGGLPENKSSLVGHNNFNRSFEEFYQKTKNSCVVERWNFGGVLWDPIKSMTMLAASEIDIDCGGNIRLIRCVQVYQDMSAKVFIEGVDMTRIFTTGIVKDPEDVIQLIDKVATAAICGGIKNFGPTDKICFPHCVFRGKNYYSPECPVVVDSGVVSLLCTNCRKLEEIIHRRNVRETNLLLSKGYQISQVRNNKNTFAKLLYNVLTDLVAESSVDAQQKERKRKRTIPSEAKEYSFQSHSSSSAHGMHSIQMEGGQIQQFKTEKMEKVEQSTKVHDMKKVIFRNCGDFTLTEGQEYELIGEQVSNNDGRQVLKVDAGSNNIIEIIEIDDQTFSQLTNQNIFNFV